jgi:hypothetical protein
MISGAQKATWCGCDGSRTEAGGEAGEEGEEIWKSTPPFRQRDVFHGRQGSAEFERELPRHVRLVEAAPDKEWPPAGRDNLELRYAAGCDPLIFQLEFQADLVFAYVCSTVWESVPVRA